MKPTLKKLKELTITKNYKEIKNILIEANSTYKGKLFEEYIGMLYEGNGYISTIVGGKNDGGADVLLSRPSNPSKIIWVIQCKNRLEPVNDDLIAYEFSKYERKAKIKYKDSSYRMISLSGYTNYLNKFRDIDISLEDFEYVKLLIDNYEKNSNEDNILLPDLKPHNLWSYKEASSLLKRHNKVTIPNATGTGKSYIASQFIYDFIGKKVIVISSSNECLNSIRKVSIWSKKYAKYVTYKKLSHQNLEKDKDYHDIDLIILDEMHRAGAKEWGKSVNQLLNININAKIVALSATPIRYLDGNRNMIDELTNGIHTTPINLFDCIARGILPNPKYVTALYNIDAEIDKPLNLLSKQGKGKTDEIRDKLVKIKQDFSNSDFIINTIKKYSPQNSKGLKFIVFCENKSHLNNVYSDVIKWFSEIYGLKYRIKPSVVVSGQSGNEKELEDFENDSTKDIKILFCIDKLNEGIHIKNGGINAIFLLRKTSSPNIYLQQIGRVFDCSKSVEEPIIFDFVNNIENINSNYFSKSLKESSDNLNATRQKLGLEPIQIEIKSFKETPDILNKVKNIETKAFLKWDDYFELVKEFKLNTDYKLSSCLIKKSSIRNEILEKLPKLKEANISLAELFEWCHTQKKRHVQKKLTNEEFEKLISIDFFHDTIEHSEARDLDTFKYNLSVLKEQILAHVEYAEKYSKDNTIKHYDNYLYGCIKMGNYILPKKYFQDFELSKCRVLTKYHYPHVFKSFGQKNIEDKKDPYDIFHSNYTKKVWLLIQANSYINDKLNIERKKYFEKFLEEIDLSIHFKETKNLYIKHKNTIKNEIDKYIEFYLKEKEKLSSSDNNMYYSYKLSRANSCEKELLYMAKNPYYIKELQQNEIKIVISIVNRYFLTDLLCFNSQLRRDLYKNPYLHCSREDILVELFESYIISDPDIITKKISIAS